MYIYRAINELDDKINPLKNGIIAKGIIDEMARYGFDFLIYSEQHKIGKNNLENLSKSDIKDIYFDIINLLIETYWYEILQKSENNQNRVNRIFRNAYINDDKESLNQIITIFQTINGHITTGSEKDYPWISFSTDLKAIKKYYEHQQKNKIVVIDSNIKNIVDVCDSNFLIAADLSNIESIRNNPFLINNLGLKTSENYRGYNYTRDSKEIVYYNMVPKEKIVTILNALQYELLTNELLDEEYYNVPELKKIFLEKKILYEMKQLFENHNDITNYLLEEYYNKSNSLRYLSEQGKYNMRQLECAKEYINQKIKEKYKKITY